jgi:hypothetical protein
MGINLRGRRILLVERMKRECTLCRQAFLHRVVQKYHPGLAVCFDCEKAIVQIMRSNT